MVSVPALCVKLLEPDAKITVAPLPIVNAPLLMMLLKVVLVLTAVVALVSLVELLLIVREPPPPASMLKLPLLVTVPPEAFSVTDWLPVDESDIVPLFVKVLGTVSVDGELGAKFTVIPLGTLPLVPPMVPPSPLNTNVP